VKLQGKVARVTGASQGIGRAIALALATEGAHVAVNYLQRVEAAMEVRDAIHELGQKAITVQADVAVNEHVETLIQHIIQQFERIDVLVNNATIHRGRRIDKLPEQDWDTVLDSCLKGAFHCCRHVVPHMTSQRSGRIINLSSAVGLIG
jgi:3-oxoacyl-[acyl-carrier protein] reductase